MAAWSEIDLESLRRLYPNYNNDNLATMFGRSVSALRGMAKKLGLNKSPAYLAQYGGRFDKGGTSWNKGNKGYCAPGAEKGWFKKGGQPHTSLPVGSLRVNKDGILQRKISDASGNHSVRWRGVHELVWIEHHGPLPAGHFCVFRPGFKTTVLDEITVDRVECISLQENMRRNTVHNLPPELAAVVQLRGVLTRAINDRERAGL